MIIDGVTGESPAATLAKAASRAQRELEPYEIGQRVRFLDVEGEIISTSSDYWHRYMTVRLDSGRELLFEKDGRYWPESNVKLEVIGKVKPKVKMWKWAYEKHGLQKVTDLLTEETATTFFNTDLTIKGFTKLPWTETEVEDA